MIVLALTVSMITPVADDLINVGIKDKPKTLIGLRRHRVKA
jgi:hypothetical protein